MTTANIPGYRQCLHLIVPPGRAGTCMVHDKAQSNVTDEDVTRVKEKKYGA